MAMNSDNTEQQAVGGEELHEILLCVYQRGVMLGQGLNEKTNSERYAEPDNMSVGEAEQRISRHYIAKDAVAAAIGGEERRNYLNGYEYHQEEGRNELRRWLREELNLDSGTEKQG